MLYPKPVQLYPVYRSVTERQHRESYSTTSILLKARDGEISKMSRAENGLLLYLPTMEQPIVVPYVGFFFFGTFLFLALLIVYFNRRAGRYKSSYHDALALNKNLKMENQVLEKLAWESKLLLRETHHRVKNNLQTVIGMLRSQSTYLKDQGAKETLIEAMHRVQAIALIHRKLYRNENGESVFMPEYIDELVRTLRYHFKPDREILFKQRIEPLRLSVSQALALGLILNEAITNSFKHAFPNSLGDTVSIRLSRMDNSELRLSISDNGKGLPEGFDMSKQHGTFGLRLIKGMSEDLNGAFRLRSINGTSVSVTFCELHD